MYLAIDVDGILGAMFVDGHGIGLDLEDAKRSYAARQELVVAPVMIWCAS